MTDPTEAEIEAAALAACNTRRELYGSPMIASLAALIPEARENELLFACAALTAAAQVRERLAAPAWDSPHNRYCAAVEELAMKIYAGFEYTGSGKKPAWTPHGNATMQDHARALARRQLLPIYSATEDQD